MVTVGLFFYCIKVGVTRSQTKALFPATSRIKRGVATAVNPTFHNSFNDALLLFEILLGGVDFEASGKFSVKDAELASLRKTRNLEAICEVIPRKITDIFKLISDLSNHTGHLHQEDFERTLLTLVYITQKMVRSATEHQRHVWAQSFLGIYKAIKQDLMDTN
nr:protein FAM180A-like [Monopterus albus]